MNFYDKFECVRLEEPKVVSLNELCRYDIIELKKAGEFSCLNYVLLNFSSEKNENENHLKTLLVNPHGHLLEFNYKYYDKTPIFKVVGYAKPKNLTKNVSEDEEFTR